MCFNKYYYRYRCAIEYEYEFVVNIITSAAATTTNNDEHKFESEPNEFGTNIMLTWIPFLSSK